MQVLYTGSNWNLEMFQFCGGSESGVLREKPWSKERTNSKLNSYIMVLGSPGIKPWRHLWEAIALTTAQSLLLTSVSFIVIQPWNGDPVHPRMRLTRLLQRILHKQL